MGFIWMGEYADGFIWMGVYSDGFIWMGVYSRWVYLEGRIFTMGLFGWGYVQRVHLDVIYSDAYIWMGVY